MFHFFILYSSRLKEACWRIRERFCGLTNYSYVHSKDTQLCVYSGLFDSFFTFISETVRELNRSGLFVCLFSFMSFFIISKILKAMSYHINVHVLNLKIKLGFKGSTSSLDYNQHALVSELKKLIENFGKNLISGIAIGYYGRRRR